VSALTLLIRFVAALAALTCVLGSSMAAQSSQSAPAGHSHPTLAAEITSPLGRTGISGPVRIVARITPVPGTTLSPVSFYVDGKLVGEVAAGPPYAVEWLDENPFEKREIAVQVADSHGDSARDVVELKPLEITQSTSVSGVLVEPMVRDAKGRVVNGLTAADFHLFEDGVTQTIEQAVTNPIPATYTLLIDSSQSMSRRMEFVRDAAREFPQHLRTSDDVMVVPFSRSLGAITGPTKDRDTLAGAIDAIKAGGGTAILDCLTAVAGQLKAVPTRHIIVLVTDGYDENSSVEFEKALDAIKADGTTVYIIAIGGVAGISLKGEDLLRRVATETGGRAFFPARDSQLADVHAQIASDVQERYLITYEPTNQKFDGKWRQIKVTTSDPTYKVQARPGYFGPAPAPVRPQLELTIKDLNRQYLDVTPDDLVVVEDGVEQKIEGFEEALSPVSVMLLLDASGSMRSGAAQVVAAARSFVAALPAQDSLAVMLFADKPALVQDLSTKRESSLAAIDQYQASGGTALYDALWNSLARLQRVEARRAIVVMTDGRDEDNPGTGPGSVHSFADVVASVPDVGATIFGIGLGAKVDRGPLERLAEISGGEAYFPEDVTALEENYHRVLENLRRRFVIMYTSTNDTHDGGWRRVEIRSRRTGIVVESKGGYFAPTDAK
jgi:Ca-activated chloride channel family protein